MNSIRLPLATTLAVTTAIVQSAEPSPPLSEELASRLINLRSRNSTPQINVALMIEGSENNKGFQTRYLQRVIAVHPVISEGRQIRRVQTYDFNWSPAHGWFLWEQRQERGGEAVWIWSERLGEIIVR